MIYLKSKREIGLMKSSGSVTAEVLEDLKQYIKPGIKTSQLDEAAEKIIIKRGGRPAFKNYRGYPSSICVSLNDVIVHGIPGSQILSEGDIVSIDVGVEMKGYYSDAAYTYPVGKINDESARLIEITRESLKRGIDKSLAGNKLSEISCAIQDFVEKNGFNVIKTFVGHGIGTKLHEAPEVPNFGTAGTGVTLETGMVIAIEPMVCVGKEDVKILSDGWTAVTVDGSRVAHFEHTVAITDNGPEVLTLCQKKKPFKLKG